MAGANQVQSTVTTAAAAPITQPSFNVGMLAGYHTHYADRQRTYQASNWSQAMVADGFSTTEPIYRKAQLYFSQPQAPQSLVIGRRANAFTQTLNLLLTDTVSGNQYSFTAIGSDDVAHPISVPSTGVAATDATTISSYFAATGGPVTHLPVGFTGPAVTFTGTATSNETILIVMKLGGAVATATFDWYLNGTIQAQNVVTASTVSLTGTGLTANFAAGTYVGGSSPETYSVTAIINCGTVSHSSATVTFTQAAGKLTDIVGWMAGPVQNIQLSDATADPGITADLQAILGPNSLSFYGVALDSNSKAEVLAAMKWIEGLGTGATGKFGFFESADAADVNLGGVSTTDVFASAQALSYHKSACIYSGSEVLSGAGASAMGYCLAQPPGRYTLNGKGLPGVPADTDASLTGSQWPILNTSAAGNPATGGKNGNYYSLNNGQTVVQPGVTPGGDFIDYIIWKDSIAFRVQASVYAAKNAGPKLPFDSNGLQVLKTAIATPLNLDSEGLLPAVVPGTVVVTMPTLAQISNASLQARDVPNAAWSCDYDAAIQTVEASGTVVLA